jgi:ABC-type nitrate/sulfonate/bicarbonate transport system substrate-binding protein
VLIAPGFEANMHRFIRLGAAPLAALLVLAESSHAPAAETRLRVNVFANPQNIALYAAQQKGFFARHGLAVEIQFTPNSRAQRTGLVQGAFEIAQAAVDNAVALVEVEKADVIIVAGGSDGLNELMVRPEINSYADIRGRAVVVDQPDTAYALLLYKMLAVQGLHKGDYRVIPGGDCAARHAAVQPDKGGVAAMMNPPCNFIVRKEGFKSFGRPTDVVGPYLADGIWVMRPWAQRNADTLVRYLQAIIAGSRWSADAANRAEAAAIVAKYLEVDADVAVSSVEAGVGPHGGLARDARIDLAGFANTLRLRAEMIGGDRSADPQKYLDMSYYGRALERP